VLADVGRYYATD